MNGLFKKMTYAEFKDWCNERACDGQWGVIQGMACISIIEKIEEIKIKGFFKKKATEKAKELAWRELITNQDFM